MTVVLRHHWTQAQAATAMGVSRRTIRNWCRPTVHPGKPWRVRPAILTPDPEASAREGRPMYAITAVVAAELKTRTSRNMRGPRQATERIGGCK